MKLIQTFFRWLPIGVSIFLTFGFVYFTAQQNYRMSLNDPQIQIVRDAEQSLLSGKTQADVVGRTPLFDIEKSLAPFVAVYDSNGKLLESSASIGGQTPMPPLGVFQNAKTNGENRVSWQPNSSTRIALVVRYVAVGSGLFVASGRNMSEVESRIDKLTQGMLLALIFALIISFVSVLLSDVAIGRIMVR